MKRSPAIAHSSGILSNWGHFGLSVLLIGLIFPVWGHAAGKKIRIEDSTQLPPHTYQIEGQASDLLENAEALGRLAAAVKRDLLDDLETYEIPDRATLKGYYADLRTIAFLEQDFTNFEAYFRNGRNYEDKEALRQTMGWFSLSHFRARHAMYRTRQKGAKTFQEQFRRELRSFIAPLSYEVVGSVIGAQRKDALLTSRKIIEGGIHAEIQPVLDGNDGEIGKEHAISLVNDAYMVRYYLPLAKIIGEELTDYISKNKKEKPDIWAKREVDLSNYEGGHPVVLGIWDSGVDTEIFRATDQMWTNEFEIPDNRLDDDENGFVDDVHGIAFTLQNDRTTGDLYPNITFQEVGEYVPDREMMRRLMRGFNDLRAVQDTPESKELQNVYRSLGVEMVGSFFENLNLYANYSHGTHVAGIGARGNPYARLTYARITFDHKNIPDEPTVEWGQSCATAYSDTIQWFKDSGVRAVNMSWGESAAYIEENLIQNNAGGTAEEQRALALKIFSIVDEALYDAIKNAPEILFITGAGNADDANTFEREIPSSYDLPNILSTGAVDQAGDETYFTSFGKVDIYANGHQVVSYVPGGGKVPFDGTSMSSPQVLNLIGKLLAVEPSLTVGDLRRLIVSQGDEHSAGERTVRLMNPRRSFDALMNERD